MLETSSETVSPAVLRQRAETFTPLGGCLVVSEAHVCAVSAGALQGSLHCNVRATGSKGQPPKALKLLHRRGHGWKGETRISR
jgi:hypothetical protein